MSIQIKSVARPQPGVAGGGVKKFYASPVHGREISLDGLTKAIEKTSTVSEMVILYAPILFPRVTIDDCDNAYIRNSTCS